MIELRELCESLNISRRTIQGYEKEGLVVPTGKNRYGYLLYDDEARERIAKIRFYQKLGFTRKEIRDIIDAPLSVIKPELEKRGKELEKEIKSMNELLEKMYQLIMEN